MFEDRAEAGRFLAVRLKEHVVGDAIVLAIPSGGVPVGVSIAKSWGWPMDLVIVRKLQIPFNPEAGFGAVTMSGKTILNEGLVSELGLTSGDIDSARNSALAEGRSREKALRGSRVPLPIEGKTAILVDDGLASGYTMLAAIGQVKDEGASRAIVAVPTGAEHTVELVAEEVDLLICLNIRRGPFAVADAYRNWYDLTEEEALTTLRAVI